MFSDLVEVIQWVDQLSNEMAEIAEDELATTFNHALRAGGTPNELLGLVRTSLIHFERSKVPARTGNQQKVRAALKLLDQNMGPRPIHLQPTIGERIKRLFGR